MTGISHRIVTLIDTESLLYKDMHLDGLLQPKLSQSSSVAFSSVKHRRMTYIRIGPEMVSRTLFIRSVPSPRNKKVTFPVGSSAQQGSSVHPWWERLGMGGRVDSPIDCCTNTGRMPSVPPRTSSICCSGKFLSPFSYRATLGSPRAPGLYTISSSGSSWKNLQRLHEKMVTYYPNVYDRERKLHFLPPGSWTLFFNQDLCKVNAKKKKPKSHLFLLFLNIHLVLRRYKTWPKKQWD